MSELMDAIATGRTPQNSGEDNLHTMALVEACYRSVADHRPVRVSEIEVPVAARESKIAEASAHDPK